MAEENTNTATNTDPTPKGDQQTVNTGVGKAVVKVNAEDVKANLLKSLGVESVEDLQAIINAKNEADEANKTELQKANDQAIKLQNDLDSKDDELATAKAQVEALKLGVDDEHLSDAILLAKAENAEDISKGLESVVKRNPQFKGEVQTKTNSDGTSVLDDNLGGGDEADKDLTPDQRAEKLNEFRII